MENVIKESTCCFFGHRKVNVTNELINRLNNIIERMIVEEKIDTFLFGSKSEFDEFSLKVVTKLKDKYPHIRRIYVRAEFPYIDNDYRAYLLKQYEDTYFPENLVNAGRASYVERNYEMIDKSKFCVIYYDESYMPPKRKNNKDVHADIQPNSGTKLAYDYANKKKIKIINVK